MVQKEVNTKTRIYGTAAVLSAIILVSLIFVFGAAPGLTPLVNPPTVSGMKTFADETALRDYLVANTKGASTYDGGPLDSKYFEQNGGNDYFVSPTTPSTAGESSSADSNFPSSSFNSVA